MSEERAFDPEELLRVLAEHGVNYVLIGGLAGTLHGSPYVTTVAGITPSLDPANLSRLTAALDELDARVRAPGEPEGLVFDRSPEALAGVEVLNLTTLRGNLDLHFMPSGTSGYDDLRRRAVEIRLHGTRVVVAHLGDVIRSKEAAGREKDRLTLPTLRRLLARLEG